MTSTIVSSEGEIAAIRLWGSRAADMSGADRQALIDEVTRRGLVVEYDVYDDEWIIRPPRAGEFAVLDRRVFR